MELTEPGAWHIDPLWMGGWGLVTVPLLGALFLIFRSLYSQTLYLGVTFGKAPNEQNRKAKHT